ncbi:hypothetical protein [Fenollaria timonensis]|jgi:hypothetical protein|uniref:hypothetical protein n=1 Tax=Fenollaria timonensis TaxID=1723384 RepID=UPI00071CE9B2|nr:hypothetical protein [Fenollaria timonensis]
MRKYINKGLIIILLILANLFLPINSEEPNYADSEVKKRFTLAKDKNDTQLKKAKKIDIAKHDSDTKAISKDEIINKVIMSTTNSFISYSDFDEEDPFDILDEFGEEDEDGNEEAIVLESEISNHMLDTWEAKAGSVYYQDEKSIVFCNDDNNNKNIIIVPKNDILIKKEYLSIDFTGCSEAKLKIIKDGKEAVIDLEGASDFKYFYIGNEFKGARIESIEFIRDKDMAFYLSIGEIDYE